MAPVATTVNGAEVPVHLVIEAGCVVMAGSAQTPYVYCEKNMSLPPLLGNVTAGAAPIT